MHDGIGVGASCRTQKATQNQCSKHAPSGHSVTVPSVGPFQSTIDHQHDTYSFAELLRWPGTDARFVPSKTPNGFVTALRSKPPIVVGRQQSVSASDSGWAGATSKLDGR
jgi:hypothetical protein